ncbi:MAG: RDD family protein, partial [Planctomycetes bacterium]|nr:RDD family protein [Planctomycetota bacterium]
NPFGDATAGKESGNPYQAPTAYGYTRPAIYSLPLSSRWKRLAGAIADGFFYMIGAGPGFILMIATAEQNDAAAMAGLGLMLLGMLAVGIINWVMITRSGQSIAKRMLGMRIIRYDTGELPGFVNGVLLRSWVPAAINQACNLFGLIDAVWIFNEERRCIHDLIAQTVVIDV